MGWCSPLWCILLHLVGFPYLGWHSGRALLVLWSCSGGWMDFTPKLWSCVKGKWRHGRDWWTHLALHCMSVVRKTLTFSLSSFFSFFCVFFPFLKAKKTRRGVRYMHENIKLWWYVQLGCLDLIYWHSHTIMCTNYLNNKTCLFNVVDIWTTKQTYRKDYVGLIQDNMNGWRGNMFAKGNLIACDNSIGILCGIYISHVFVNKSKRWMFSCQLS